MQRAWFGGFTGVQARKAVPGAQAIAQGAEDAAFKTTASPTPPPG
ncbi:hypothetical protein [Methylobacterium sp. J-088]|nr:hypothetical protein [Methylobacterium sp. J-088]